MPPASTLQGNTAKHPLYQYYFRALIVFAAVGTLATQLTYPIEDWLAVGTIIFLLVYVYVAFMVTRKVSDAKRGKVVGWLGHVDAALIGSVLGLVNFSLLPTILFATLIQFNALLHGGIRKWITDNVAFAAGIFVSVLLHQPQLMLKADVQISVASLIGITTYFCAYALFTHNTIRNLEDQLTRLTVDQKQLKLRAYKLSRYIAPPIWKAIFAGREVKQETQRKKLTIFFSDVKGFTELSEELEAEALTDLLNQYLTEMSKIANHYGGTIDKFIGDSIMVFFGDPSSRGIKQDALACVSMAISMKKRMKELQQHWFNQGIEKPLEIRMGINTGYCTVGSFGTDTRLDYTVLGTEVNLASRLESAAAPGSVLISHETYALVKDVVMCRDKGTVQVKGFSQPVRVYEAVDFRKDLGRNQSYFEHTLDGFSMYLDLEKVKNYDKDQVIQSLEQAAEKLRDKVIL